MASLRVKLPLIFFITTLIPFIVGAVLLLTFFRNELINREVERLTVITEQQVRRVEEAVDRYLEWAELIASRTRLRNLTAEFIEGGDEALIPDMQNIMQDALLSLGDIVAVESIYEGGIIASTGLAAQYATEDELIDLHTSSSSSEFGVLFKDENNRILVQVSAPMYLDGEHISTLVMYASAETIINIVNDYAGMGETGEVLLSKKNSAGDIIYLAPLRFDRGAALREVVSPNNNQLPAVSAANSITGVLYDAIDYRENDVIAVLRYIDSVEWGLTAKIDQDEVLGPVRRITGIFVLLLAAVYIAMLFLWVIVSSRITDPIRALAKEARQLGSGDFSVDFSADTNDEIGQLSTVFKKVAGRLKESYEDLENKVADRSKQLTLALNRMESQNADLANSKARDEAILYSIADGLIVTNTRGEILIVNDAFERILGFSRDDVLGKKLADAIDLVDENGILIPYEKRPISNPSSRKRNTGVDDYFYITKSGEKIPVQITMSPISVDGHEIGMVEVFRDRSKEYEVDRAKTEFVSLASHQLRTPLTSLNWYAELLLDEAAKDLSEEERSYVLQMADESKRMTSLVNSLLNVSRLELGTFMIEPEDVDVQKFFKTHYDEILPIADERKIQVKMRIEPDVKTLSADKNLLGIIVQNLLSNAVKYSKDGGIVDAFIRYEGEGEKKMLVYSVKDSGIGIPKAQQKEIFGKLFRADNARSSDAEGTGLGLYIVKSILDATGGSVSFVSKEGEGTEFTVNIPASGMKGRKGQKRLE